MHLGFREEVDLDTLAGWVRSQDRERLLGALNELPVVLLEDTGALVGLLFALTGVVLAEVTGNPWILTGLMLQGLQGIA